MKLSELKTHELKAVMQAIHREIRSRDHLEQLIEVLERDQRDIDAKEPEQKSCCES